MRKENLNIRAVIKWYGLLHTFPLVFSLAYQLIRIIHCLVVIDRVAL